MSQGIGELLAEIVAHEVRIEACEKNLKDHKRALSEAKQAAIDYMLDNEIESISMFRRVWKPVIAEYASVASGGNDIVVEWLCGNVPGATEKVKRQMHHKSRDSLLRGELYDEDTGEWNVPDELADVVTIHPVRDLSSRNVPR